jgi:O-antigen/teichoic acid export membrane protein
MGILGRHYLHTVVSNFVLKFVIGLVIGVVTARALGPEGRGDYNLLALIITTVTTLFNFGVPGTNTYFTAQKKFGKEKLYRASIVFAVTIGIASLVVLYLLYRFNLFGILFPTDKLSFPIVASLGIIPIVLFNLFAQGVIVGENKIVLNNYITVSSQGALALSLAILYFTGALSVTSAIVLYALSYVLSFAIILITSFPPLGDVLRSRIRWSEYRTMLGFSTTIHVGNLTQFFNYRLDAFIVNYFLGTAAVGLYVTSSVLGETLWLLSASMASVLLPTLAGQHEKSKEIAVKAAVATFAVSVAGGVAAFLAGPFLIVLLFGEKFAGSIEPFLILIPGVVIFSITNVLATYLTGAGKPGYNAAIAFISFLFTVIFDILLIPRYGISGAAVASGISYTMSSIMTVIVFARVSAIGSAEFASIVKSMSTDVRSIVTRMRRRLGLAHDSSGITGTK